jgi:ketosteroid isomerase-like protein
MHQIRFEVEELWEAGDSVVVALRLTAKGKQTDIPVAQRTAGVWTIQDGKIHRIKAYASTSQALEAAGLAN